MRDKLADTGMRLWLWLHRTVRAMVATVTGRDLTPRLWVYESTHRDTGDGDRITIRERDTYVPMMPDYLDWALGDGRNPAEYAAHYMQKCLYISGRESCSSWDGGRFPGGNVWYSTGCVEHPYEDKCEETTVHLYGFTERELRRVWELVTA